MAYFSYKDIPKQSYTLMFRNSLSIFCALLLTTIWCNKITAQYFYKDVWSPQQLMKEMNSLKSEKIRTISIKSFEDNGEPSEGFFCEKKIDKDYSRSETVTRSLVTNQSLLTSHFNSKGQITETVDSTESSISRTQYFYNDNGNVNAIKTFTKAEDDSAVIQETHNYFYDPNGALEKMTRQKNSAEISTVNFNVDEKGNIIEEEELFKNGGSKKYFYYYDDKNRLTDIVHYNERAKRLLPDYMYEYNSAGQIKQMISIEEGTGYFVWKYLYNDKNLREAEKCFSKERKLLGSIQYEYK
jgi:hypothetical protein